MKDEMFKKSANLSEQISQYIKEKIVQNIYRPGEKLPSEAEFSRTLGVSRNSVREALGLLESVGLIVKRQGVGTFVTANKPLIKGGIEHLTGIKQFIADNGYNSRSKLLYYRRERVSLEIAEKLGLKTNNEILAMESLKIANDYPVTLCIDIIPYNLLNEPVKPELLHDSVFEGLKLYHGIDIRSAECEILSAIVDPLLAEKMSITPDNPVLLLKQIHYDSLNRKVLYSKSYFPSDRFTFKLVRYQL
jgi:GntR family transcriptional regulator